MIITFDENSKRDILNAFNMSVDSEDYIIDKKSLARIILPDGKAIKMNEFAGMYKDKIIRKSELK